MWQDAASMAILSSLPASSESLMGPLLKESHAWSHVSRTYKSLRGFFNAFDSSYSIDLGFVFSEVRLVSIRILSSAVVSNDTAA